MFSGLILTTISVATMRAALFNRKSRSGWLEELDGIRTDALEEPGELGHVARGDDVWMDLRDGGEYSDPHEISSLYANDDTPDLPVTRPARKPAKPSKSAKPAAHATEAAAPPPPPPPPPPASVEPPVIEEAAIEEPVAEATGWPQPAPHPVRPSEMWHAPAEGLAEAPGSFTAPAEERIASAELEAEPSRPQRVSGLLESELIGAADMTIVDGVAPAAPTQEAANGLVGAPVGRRVRRDRPTERRRGVLPTPVEGDPSDPSDRSPLPVAPLPPAAMPTKANRLPGIESLPATPSAIVPEKPVEQAKPAEPAITVAEVPVGADDLIAVDGTIVRVGGAKLVSAVASGHTTVVALTEGWCWVSPGDGPADSVRIELPTGTVAVGDASTALVVVEADRSSFVFVADGTVELRRGGDGAPLGRGAIAMLDPAGTAQVDQATDDELQADPIVAHNLTLDANL